VAVAAGVLTVPPAVCGFLVWKLRHVTRLSLRVLRWLLDDDDEDYYYYYYYYYYY
jgi:hypothetical protein